MATIPWSVLQRLDGRRAGRFYETPDGVKVPSVTTILSVIGKPALVPWAARTERELVVEAAANLYLDLPSDPRTPRMKRDAYVRTLSERIGAEKAHQRISKKATDVGGEAHKLIEWNLRRELGQEAGPEPRVSAGAAVAFTGFQSWWQSAGMKPLYVEQMVFHPGELFAGTADLLAETADGEMVLVDFKTSKAIYPEYLLQVAAYAEAVNAMGHGPIRRGVIVRFPKSADEPAFSIERDVVWVGDFETRHFPVFLQAKALWTWLQEADPFGKDATPPSGAVASNGTQVAAGNGAGREAARGAGGREAAPAAPASGEGGRKPSRKALQEAGQSGSGRTK